MCPSQTPRDPRVLSCSGCLLLDHQPPDSQGRRTCALTMYPHRSLTVAGSNHAVCAGPPPVPHFPPGTLNWGICSASSTPSPPSSPHIASHGTRSRRKGRRKNEHAQSVSSLTGRRGGGLASPLARAPPKEETGARAPCSSSASTGYSTTARTEEACGRHDALAACFLVVSSFVFLLAT